MLQAEQLRAQFRRIPKDCREANQGFSIRVWRATSWLQRAESLDAIDVEGRFISCWIGFNALYGRTDDRHRPWGDRESLGAFLAKVWNLDCTGDLRRILGKRQAVVLRLLDNKFLSSVYWEGSGAKAARQINKEVKNAILTYMKPNRLRILRLLFERLYVMRNQVFHGASTKGSYLNRRTLSASANILMDLLPACLAIMIENGASEDWGGICFPPQD